MEIKASAIVARCVNYRESDKILTLITREFGRIEASARGSRNTNSRLLACTAQFCYGDYVLYKKGDKYTVRQGDILDSFYAIRSDYERLFAGSGMLACAATLSLPGEADEPLFMWTLIFLSTLCHSDVNPIDISLCFIVKIMAQAGYRPALDACAHCETALGEEVLLDPVEGGVVCRLCASHRAFRVHALSVRALERMLLVEPENLHNVRLPDYVREELSRFLPEYAERKMEKTFSAFQVLFKPES